MRRHPIADVLQFAHILCCTFSLLMMAIYPHFQLTETGMVLIMLSALPLCGCIVVPIGLIGCILQIIRCIRHRKQTGTRPPVGLIVWATLGPVVCLALLMAAAVVHVELTGGV